jgi:release factor glutamine methyltransferase
VSLVAAATVRDALEGAVDAIAASGSPSARLDAELLLAEATGIERVRLAAEPEATLPAGSGREFAAMVRRRVRHEPVAYILGRKGFRMIEVAVDPGVLVPRPETELLVEFALEVTPSAVLDVGTGSGAVALAIADELPGASVLATDTSAGAVEVARANAESLGLSSRVEVIEGSYPAERGPFDLLVANLPYVSEAEWAGLGPDIREYEPREALVAGPSGLEAFESLLAQVREAGPAPGAIALEVGAGQATQVAELLERAGYASVEARRDIAGIERVVAGRS